MTDDDKVQLPEQWVAAGRHYGVTTCTGPDKTWWELDDLAPAPGRGTLVIVEHDDASRSLTVSGVSPEFDFPFEVLEGFVLLARARADAANGFLDEEQATRQE